MSELKLVGDNEPGIKTLFGRIQLRGEPITEQPAPHVVEFLKAQQPLKPEVGDLVRVHACKTPGHQRRAYIGRVTRIFDPDDRGYQSCSVISEDYRRGFHNAEWLHQMSILSKAAKSA